MLRRGANRVKLGTIIHIHTHPIKPEVHRELFQEAKELIEEEKRVTAEGGDPHEMNIDKNLFKAFLLETPDSKRDNKNPAKVATVIMAANAFQRKKKSVSCVLL